MFHMPEGFQWLVILGVALLIWGRRLPEVGRSLGKGIVEFKKGIKGIEEEVDQQSSAPSPKKEEALPQISQQQAPQYKFDPYTGKPLTQSEQAPQNTQHVG